MRRVLTAAIAAAAFIAVPGVANATVPVITGTTYYVSPTGSDSNNGTSQATPWQTIAKVNSKTLNPGDGVLFRAGSTFIDTLEPLSDGTAAGGKIVYGAYDFGGATTATINPPGNDSAIYLEDDHHQAFDDLNLVGPGAVTSSQGFLASATGAAGSDHILLHDMNINNWGIGVNSANAQDDTWEMDNSVIDEIGADGMQLKGAGPYLLEWNTITDVSKDTSISVGTHGVYGKAQNITARYNTIRRFKSNGFSIRKRNSRLENNTISDGAIGIAYFECDSGAATSDWNDNTIQRTTSTGIYLTGSDNDPNCGPMNTNEHFNIARNNICRASTGATWTNFATPTAVYTYSFTAGTHSTAPC